MLRQNSLMVPDRVPVASTTSPYPFRWVSSTIPHRVSSILVLTARILFQFHHRNLPFFYLSPFTGSSFKRRKCHPEQAYWLQKWLLSNEKDSNTILPLNIWRLEVKRKLTEQTLAKNEKFLVIFPCCYFSASTRSSIGLLPLQKKKQTFSFETIEHC